MSTSNIKLVHLTREIGTSGGGNAAYSYISKIAGLGYNQFLIHQHGDAKNLEILKSERIQPTFFQKILVSFEKYIFSRYPIRKDTSLLSTGIFSMKQRRIRKLIREFLGDRSEAYILCHWVNLGFISLGTLLWATKIKNAKLIIHLHDLWILQDLAHQPKYTGYGLEPQTPQWSLIGHPNFLQSALQRRSRRLKRELLKNSIITVSSKELEEFLKISPEYSKLSTTLDIRELPMPLEYLVRQDLKTPTFEKRNFLLMIGNHPHDDARKDFISAINGYISSDIQKKCPLFVVCGISKLSKDQIEIYETQNVYFFETLNHKDCLEVMSMCRGVIIPSSFETFGLTIFEAAVTAPIVGIAIGSIQDTLLENLGLKFTAKNWTESGSWDELFPVVSFEQGFQKYNFEVLQKREAEVGAVIKKFFEMHG